LLEGLKVIDLASFLAAPGAATLMADYGAEVIKIEPSGGDGYRRLRGNWKTDYNWQLTSRNKLGMSIDITSSEGRDILLKLLEDADVLVTNFRKDQLEKYSISYDLLHAQFPRLIVAQLTGYGNVGPDRRRRGYDSTAWFAQTGIMQLMKPKNGPPVFPAGGVGDHSTAMSLFAGIMMALFKREKQGKGSFVETSLVANGCWANGMSLQGAISGYDLGEFLDKSSRSPFAMVYETRDSRYVILVFTNPVKEWPEFANALGRSEWLDDQRFLDMRTLMRNRDEMKQLIAHAIGALKLSDLSIALDKYGLTYGVVNGLTEVVRDAHLIENDIVIKTESEDPDFEWTIANPIKISGEEVKPAIDPPDYGEHTRRLLREHGFSKQDVETLIKEKVAFVGEF
jgi:formyl-CoA transferase